MKPLMIILLIIVAVIAYLYMFPASLISEATAFEQCTKVSGAEASCNFYNRGIGPFVYDGNMEMPRFSEWAGKNSIVYDKCKVTSVSVGTTGGCSCGPGSGSYGCACSIPKQTDNSVIYSTSGNTCPIKFDRWYSDASGPADSYNNGGKAVSYSGTVIFFSETPKCGNQITCGEWSVCTSYYEKSRACTDECNIQTTEKAYCEYSTPVTPVIPIIPPVIQPPDIQPVIQPEIQPEPRNLITDITNFFKWLVTLIAIPFLPP